MTGRPTRAPAASRRLGAGRARLDGGAGRPRELEDRGRLREGAVADLVLVDGPLERDPASARVRLTVVGGEVAFEAGGS